MPYEVKETAYSVYFHWTRTNEIIYIGHIQPFAWHCNYKHILGWAVMYRIILCHCPTQTDNLVGWFHVILYALQSMENDMGLDPAYSLVEDNSRTDFSSHLERVCPLHTPHTHTHTHTRHITHVHVTQ